MQVGGEALLGGCAPGFVRGGMLDGGVDCALGLEQLRILSVQELLSYELRHHCVRISAPTQRVMTNRVCEDEARHDCRDHGNQPFPLRDERGRRAIQDCERGMRSKGVDILGAKRDRVSILCCPRLDVFEEVAQQATVGLRVHAERVYGPEGVGAELVVLGGCDAVVAFVRVRGDALGLVWVGFEALL
jgi:hypothetical protein